MTPRSCCSPARAAALWNSERSDRDGDDGIDSNLGCWRIYQCSRTGPIGWYASGSTRLQPGELADSLTRRCLLQSQRFACSKQANSLPQTPGLCILALGGLDPADIPSLMRGRKPFEVPPCRRLFL